MGLIPSYGKFFCIATCHSPYDWQGRLTCGEGYRKEDAATHSGTTCFSRLIDIPTGLGKTAGVVLAWLWNRVIRQDPSWPRRLVYCLPMRTLVEQTEHEVTRWLTNLAAKSRSGILPLSANAKEHLFWLIGDQTDTTPAHSPVLLMGGEDLDPAKRDWDLYPEKPCILIGTQDMLLSKALNRGYGMSRYRWPIHFGLLNNDCLWIMDETQLMGVGIETSAQLQGLREKLGMQEPTRTWWMSATLDPIQLETIDFADSACQSLKRLNISEEERHRPKILQVIAAPKSLEKSSVFPASDDKEALRSYAEELAAFSLDQHLPGTLTLIVVNRVGRAQDVAEALRKRKTDTSIGLVHGRFRPHDRSTQELLLHAGGDRIIVATQAVEAGVDISAATLITEVAPWPSLVQRFGRCNRDGKIREGGRIFWVDLRPDHEKDQRVPPYAFEDLTIATQLLQECTAASSQDLRSIDYQPRPEIRAVIRRKDVIGLFDTTPDLSGNDLDISRYVRDADAVDVQLYWRNFDPTQEDPSEQWAAPVRNDLCRVPFGVFVIFAKKQPVYRWNSLDERFEKPSLGLVPGATYLLPLSSGGYRSDIGWTAIAKDRLKLEEIAAHQKGTEPDAHGRDPASFIGKWISLRDHLQAVEKATADISRSFSWDVQIIGTLKTAARWHDVGKAHCLFQDLLRAAGTPPESNGLWAKSEKRGSSPKTWRRGFRHELASALAWLQAGQPDDLVAFLIATHHGKVRLYLRSMPDEQEPPETNRLFARGIWDEDELPAIQLPDGKVIGPIKLDLGCMQLGDSATGPSWLARMIQLRDTHGPFRLALLETVLRAADARASQTSNFSNSQ